MDGSDYLETHRFLLHSVSREKLGVFRDTLNSLQQQHGEIAGVVVYGSQVTGRANEQSDVDSVVFIDVNKAGLTDPEGAKLSDTKEDSNWEAMNAGLGTTIKTEVEDALAIPAEKRGGIKVRLISPERVENELNEAIEYEKNRLANQAQGDFVSGGDIPKTDIGLLFHMQLGRGLTEYRNQILTRLHAEGDVGDTVWKHHVVWDVQFGENGKLRGIDRTSKKLFPETVDAALAKFS